MKSHTEYMTFNTEGRREFVRITENVQGAVDDSGVAEGMALVSAMHITAAVWVNDDEPGLQEDTLEWLDKVAPPSWKEPANDVARELLPDPGRLPAPPRRRGQRRRPPEEPAGAPPGDPADHRGEARPRPVAGGLLLRVRWPALEEAGDQGDRRLARLRRRPAAAPLRHRQWSSALWSRCSAARPPRPRSSTRWGRPGRCSTGCSPPRSSCSRSGARGRSRPVATGSLLAGTFGVTLAGMNLCFYEALDRIPLGIAVTFEFVGPLLVGLVRVAAPARPGLGGMRRRRGPAADPALGIGERGRDRVRAAGGRVLGRLHPAQRSSRPRLSRRPGAGAGDGGGRPSDGGARNRRGRGRPARSRRGGRRGGDRSAQLGDPVLARARGPAADRRRHLRGADEPGAGGRGR